MVQYTAPTPVAVSQGGTIATQTQQAQEEQATQTALIQQHTCTQTTGLQTASSVGCQTEQQAPGLQAVPVPVQSSFTYIRHALSLPEDGRRGCMAVSWVQLAQHVEHMPSCVKSSFTKLLLEHLAVGSRNEPVGPLLGRPTHHNQEQLGQQQQQQQQGQADAVYGSSIQHQGHGSHSCTPQLLSCDDYGLGMPSKARLQQALKSRTAFSLSLFCWPALDPVGIRNIRAAGVATASQEQTQVQGTVGEGIRDVDTAQGVDQQQRRDGMATQQVHGKERQQGQQHQYSTPQADMPPIVPAHSVVTDDDQLAAFLQDALRLAQQGTANGISSEFMPQRDRHSSYVIAYPTAGSATHTTDSGSPGPAELQALAVKLQQQLHAVAAQLADAGYQPQQLLRYTDAQAAQHSGQHRSPITARGFAGRQASRAAATGQQDSGPARGAFNQDLSTLRSDSWSEDEDGLVWETELAAVAAQEAADRLTAVDIQPDVGSEHTGLEYIVPVTVSPARSNRHARSHIASTPTGEAGHLAANLRSIQSHGHHEAEAALPAGGSSHEIIAAPVQQLLMQYNKIRQRQVRLVHAWEQGLRAGISQLCQSTAMCCWTSVVRHYHMQQAQSCWHALLHQPAHASGTLSPHSHNQPSQQDSRTDASESETARELGVGPVGARADMRAHGHQDSLVRHNMLEQLTESTPELEEDDEEQSELLGFQLREWQAAERVRLLVLEVEQLEERSRRHAMAQAREGGDEHHEWLSRSSFQEQQAAVRLRRLEFEVEHAEERARLHAFREQQLDVHAARPGLAQAAGAPSQTVQQAVSELQKRLEWSEAEPAALAAASPEELTELITQLELHLSRARTALTQAVANQEHLCPVCWEQRKGMVFQCGHQTCEACSEKLIACPICRVQISLRIKTF